MIEVLLIRNCAVVPPNYMTTVLHSNSTESLDSTKAPPSRGVTLYRLPLHSRWHLTPYLSLVPALNSA